MQKERAASALQHGLPVPTPLPKRTASSARANSNPNPPSLRVASSRQGLPLAVKLLGLGLGLLGLVYGLTLLRDNKSLRDPAAIPASMTDSAK